MKKEFFFFALLAASSAAADKAVFIANQSANAFQFRCLSDGEQTPQRLIHPSGTDPSDAREGEAVGLAWCARAEWVHVRSIQGNVYRFRDLCPSEKNLMVYGYGEGRFDAHCDSLPIPEDGQR